MAHIHHDTIQSVVVARRFLDNLGRLRMVHMQCDWYRGIVGSFSRSMDEYATSKLNGPGKELDDQWSTLSLSGTNGCEDAFDIVAACRAYCVVVRRRMLDKLDSLVLR
ncbi:MAG: hypothetical protein EOO38_21260 [Cytophagaceae bacterium]|nr:MAG: hypothetical protein EOO38_21260 [Cytophagaceae bacterium]